MLQLSRTQMTLALLSGTLLLGSGACSQGTPSSKSTQVPVAASVASPAAIPASPAPQAATSQPASSPNRPDPYKTALDKADSARNISESAQSQDDWNLVASRWQQAIQLLKAVPPSSPYQAQAKSRLGEYQRSLAYAKKQAANAGSSEVASDPDITLNLPPTSSVTSARSEPTITSASPRGTGRVFQARIKRREGGTPVIDVTFNGRQTFEMIVDTGASGTVITEQMAAALNVRIIGKAKVDTASDRDVEVPLAYIDSISVGGASVKQVVVAIGNSALTVGLLGHDFFGDYDVTVKRDVVEFRQR